MTITFIIIHYASMKLPIISLSSRKHPPNNNQSLHISISPTLYQSIHRSINSLIHPSIHPSRHQSTHQSIHEDINQHINQHINQYINQYINQSILSLIHPFTNQTKLLSNYQTKPPPTHQSISP